MNEAGLQVNEAIVKINAQPVPPGASAEVLAGALKEAGPQGHVKLEVLPLEMAEFTVTLGARPADMMNLPDWQEAQMRFAAWWREASGEPSLRVPKVRGAFTPPTGHQAEVVP